MAALEIERAAEAAETAVKKDAAAFLVAAVTAWAEAPPDTIDDLVVDRTRLELTDKIGNLYNVLNFLKSYN